MHGGGTDALWRAFQVLTAAGGEQAESIYPSGERENACAVCDDYGRQGELNIIGTQLKRISSGLHSDVALSLRRDACDLGCGHSF